MDGQPDPWQGEVMQTMNALATQLATTYKTLAAMHRAHGGHRLADSLDWLAGQLGRLEPEELERLVLGQLTLAEAAELVADDADDLWDAIEVLGALK
jgi:hypothetical protein